MPIFSTQKASSAVHVAATDVTVSALKLAIQVDTTMCTGYHKSKLQHNNSSTNPLIMRSHPCLGRMCAPSLFTAFYFGVVIQPKKSSTDCT